MSLFGRLRSRLLTKSGQASSATALAEAERIMREGGSVDAIRRGASEARAENLVETAWRALFLGELDLALDAAYAAAGERPYDVDSRIVHGMVRLALDDLDHAEHEFDAVIEEFGAEPDAADGRRATILARGFAPVDELSASDEEWRTAATLLTTLWRVVDVVDQRLDGLSDAHVDGLSVIRRALAAGQAVDSEADDGTV